MGKHRKPEAILCISLTPLIWPLQSRSREVFPERRRLAHTNHWSSHRLDMKGRLTALGQQAPSTRICNDFVGSHEVQEMTNGDDV